MSSKDAPKRLIRVLIDGLTVGTEMYKIGDLIDPSGMKDLEELAGGKLVGGRRFAEWADDKPAGAVKTAPVAKPKPEPEPVVPEAEAEAPEPEPEAEPKPTAEPLHEDMGEAIKALVISGMAKGEIVKRLGEPENVSQQAVSDKFDEMLAVGILFSPARGVYTVEQ